MGVTPADILGTLTRVGDMAPLVAAAALGLIALAWGATRLILPGLPARRPAKVIGVEGRRKVGLTLKDATMHVHVLGQTGSGKSTLLVNLALQDVRAGRAVAMVDPVGDISRDLLEALPGAEDRLCLIDASDKDWAVGLDLLRGDPELVGEHLDGLFARLWPASWRERQQTWLRRAILTLAGTGATAADIPRLFTEDDFRRSVVTRLDGATHTGRRLIAEWRAFDALKPPQRAAEVGPLAGKLDLLLNLRPTINGILGQRTEANPLALLDRGGIVVLRAPQGQIGESAASLLCTAFVALVWDHLRARARTSHRPPLTLIADECQMAFAPKTLAEMLDLGRKWGLCAVLANQYLGQLSGGLGKAVAANCRTKVVFQSSDEDAYTLGGPNRTFAALGAGRLASLPAYVAAVRVRAQPPRVVKALLPPKRRRERREAAVRASRAHWGRSREAVEGSQRGEQGGIQHGLQSTLPDLIQSGEQNGNGAPVKDDIRYLRRLVTERDMRVLRRIVAEGPLLGPVLREEEFGGDSSLAARRLARLHDLGLVEKGRAGTTGGRSPMAWAATDKGREVAG